MIYLYSKYVTLVATIMLNIHRSLALLSLHWSVSSLRDKNHIFYLYNFKAINYQ